MLGYSEPLPNPFQILKSVIFCQNFAKICMSGQPAFCPNFVFTPISVYLFKCSNIQIFGYSKQPPNPFQISKSVIFLAKFGNKSTCPCQQVKLPELGKGEVRKVLRPTRPNKDWAPECTQDSLSDVPVELNHKIEN